MFSGNFEDHSKSKNLEGKSYISFSGRVKEEIAGFFPQRMCCSEAMLAAIVFRSVPVCFKDAGDFSVVEVVSHKMARLVYRLVKEISGVSPEWKMIRENRFNRRNIFHINLPDTNSMQDFKKRWGINQQLRRNNLRRSCCQRSYLAGSFLVRGSVSSPGADYHLEIIEDNDALANVSLRILAKMEIEAHITQRRKKYILYVKKADDISNLLNILGAHESLFKFEEVRAIKVTKEEVRRRVNAETANMDKTVKAAVRHIEMISHLKQMGIYDDLSESLREAADLRLSYPEASFKEIGEKCNPPVTKSSASNRFRRLEEIYARVKKGM